MWVPAALPSVMVCSLDSSLLLGAASSCPVLPEVPPEGSSEGVLPVGCSGMAGKASAPAQCTDFMTSWGICSVLKGLLGNSRLAVCS